MARQTATTLTGALADFVVDLTPADLPAGVKSDAVLRVQDTVGVALAGSRMDFARPLQAMAGHQGGRPEAAAIGLGLRLPAPLAGFVNGSLGHGPDYDDTHSVAMVHIGCTAVPAALAMAERTKARGDEFLTALVLGAEVGLRIGAAAPHRFHLRGYHATSVCGPFTAAAAASRLLGLDAGRTANALGLAGSQAAGLMQGLRDGSWVKRLHPGWSVQSGLTAALLAEGGFTGPEEVLEGGAGLYAVLLHNDEVGARLEAVTEDLGRTWLLPETTYKPYPNGAWNHSSMDAVAAMMHEAGIDHESIDRIDCHVPPECMPVVCEPREAKIHPRSAYHMKFSLPYGVAMLAVLGEIGVDDFNDAVLADGRIASLAERVFCHADEGMSPERFPARVTLLTRDGRRLERLVAAQRGGPGNPMSPDEHRAKFLANATPAVGAETAQRLLEEIAALWEAPDLTRLVSLLAGGE